MSKTALQNTSEHIIQPPQLQRTTNTHTLPNIDSPVFNNDTICTSTAHMRPALSRLMPLTTSDPLIPASPASLLSQVARIPLCWHPLPPYTSKAATDLTDLNLKLTLTSLLAVDVLSFTQVSVPSSECGHEHKLMYCQTSRFSLSIQYNTITK